VVNGAQSKLADVLSGVPQGTVLGPLFFVLFINDMPDAVHNFIALFADDAKLFSKIADDMDSQLLQEDLQQLLDWASRWQLNFNAKKCKVLHLGRLNLKMKYNMGNLELATTIEERI
jgi:hypothetical protein